MDILDIIIRLKKLHRGHKKILKGLKGVEEEFHENPELSEELKEEYEEYINDFSRVDEEYKYLEDTINDLEGINDLKLIDVEQFIGNFSISPGIIMHLQA